MNYLKRVSDDLRRRGVADRRVTLGSGGVLGGDVAFDGEGELGEVAVVDDAGNWRSNSSIPAAPTCSTGPDPADRPTPPRKPTPQEAIRDPPRTTRDDPKPEIRSATAPPATFIGRPTQHSSAPGSSRARWKLQLTLLLADYLPDD